MQRVEIPFDLDELVSEITTVLEPPARKYGLELSYQREPDLPTQLLGDPGGLRAVLLNLMSYVLRLGAGREVVLRVRDGSQAVGSFQSLLFSIAHAGGSRGEELFSFRSEIRPQSPTRPSLGTLRVSAPQANAS